MSTSPPPNPSSPIPGLSISTTGKLMLSGVVAFFFLFVLLLILILRANRLSGANPTLSPPPPPPLPFSPSSTNLRATLCRAALDPTLLNSLPITVFDPAKDDSECTVCLSEFTRGDAIRLLPSCLHGFHVDCIDKWLCSNSTCPICRSSIVDSQNSIFTTKIESFVDQNGLGEESSDFVEIKGANLRNLRRVLRMESREFGSDLTSRELDVELGLEFGLDGEGSSLNSNSLVGKEIAFEKK